MRSGRSVILILSVPYSECPVCHGPVMYQIFPEVKDIRNLAPPHATHSMCLWCVRRALCKMAVVRWGDVSESASNGAGKPRVESMREPIEKTIGVGKAAT